MKILVFEIFEKGQILRPFSGLAPSKLKILSKNLMVAYVHIEYSTHQFSEESKGGGGESIPLRSLRYRKKRGPERVKIEKILLHFFKCRAFIK